MYASFCANRIPTSPRLPATLARIRTAEKQAGISSWPKGQVFSLFINYAGKSVKDSWLGATLVTVQCH